MAKATKKQALGRGLSALLKDPQNDIKSATERYITDVKNKDFPNEQEQY